MTNTTAKISRTGLLLAIFAAFALILAIAPSPTEACGGYGPPTDEQQVRATIAQYAYALGQGDSKAINANWDLASGHTTTIAMADGAEVVRAEPIARASRRWGKNKAADLKWQIEQLDVDQGAAFAKVSLTWHGEKRVEYLTLLRVNGHWKLVGNVHVAARPGASAGSAGVVVTAN